MGEHVGLGPGRSAWRSTASSNAELAASGELVATEALTVPGGRPAGGPAGGRLDLQRRAVRGGEGAPGRLLPARRAPGWTGRSRSPAGSRRPTWAWSRCARCSTWPAGAVRRRPDVPRACCGSWRRRSSAALVRRYGDFDSCEDAVQEALLAAAVQWPAEGVPANPKGWLITTASRRRIEAWRAGVGPPAAGADRRRARPGRAGAGTARRGRHAHPAAAVLPSGADPGLPGRADAARGRRPDHRGDRPGAAGAGGDRGPADQPGQAADPGGRRPVPDAAGGRAGRRGWPPSGTCSTSSSTRATRPAPGASLHRVELTARGDPADPAAARAAARATGRSPGCSR